ncbi:S-methyl-5'-thioadenosine phosphorylase [Phycisphaerae bacterium RAS1]|nr:S-methyl-5'-thioadenosine phosphorylase [Phycisphaerae bacterium RAS1]
MIGLIGGTGLGEALFGENAGREVNIDTPYGHPSSSVRVINWHGLDIALLARHGEGHVYNPTQVPYRANVYALKALGVTHILASGAVGSLREHIHPRQLVIVDQIIDKTTRRPSTFFEGLAVHVEMAEPYCQRLRHLLLSVASKSATKVHERGTYVCMEGPAFSTMAESNMHRAWGGDVIGMTTMPEAKLAREAEICYAAIALPTDYDCWKPHDPDLTRQALLDEIIGHLKAATGNAVALMKAAIEAIAANRSLLEAPCTCRTSLDLAVWSARNKITPETARHYSVLLRRYLSRK